MLDKNINPNDQEDFQILLSKNDYQELKSWKNKFLKAQTQRKNQILDITISLSKKDQIITELKSERTYFMTQLCSFYKALYKIWSKQDDSLVLSQQKPNLSYQVQHLKVQDKLKTTQDIMNIFKTIQKQIIELFARQNDKKIDSTKTINLLKNLINKKQERMNQIQLDYKSQIQQLLQQLKVNEQQKLLLINRIDHFNKQCLRLRGQNQIICQQKIQFQDKNKELYDQLQQLEEHISILKQSLKTHHQNYQTRSSLKYQFDHFKNNKIKQKGQKQDFVKEILKDYSREIKRNLISIGNLSHEQIRQIGTSQMRTLVKFVQEIYDDFE